MGAKGSRKERCKRGHLLGSWTTKMIRGSNGYLRRECKLCRSYLYRLRYKNDPDFKERNLIKSREYYYNVRRPKIMGEQI